MPDQKKVIKALKQCAHSEECGKCPYAPMEFCEFEAMADAAALLEAMHRAWQTVKHSAIDTAQNNAGKNEDVYNILMFMVRLMQNQEKRWNDD